MTTPSSRPYAPIARATGSSGLYRNATGDEIVYLRTGAARLEPTFGALDCVASPYAARTTGTTGSSTSRGG